MVRERIQIEVYISCSSKQYYGIAVFISRHDNSFPISCLGRVKLRKEIGVVAQSAIPSPAMRSQPFGTVFAWRYNLENPFCARQPEVSQLGY